MTARALHPVARRLVVGRPGEEPRRRLQCLERASNDHVNPKTLKLGSLRRHHLGRAVGIARLDDEALSFGVAEFAHPLTESVHVAVGATALPRDIQPTRPIFADCCALAASGKPTSKQPSTLNSRRAMMVVLVYDQRGPNRTVAGR